MTSLSEAFEQTATGTLAVLVGEEYVRYVPLMEQGFQPHDVFLTLAATGPLLSLN